MKSIFIWGGVGILIAGGLILVLTFVGPQENISSGGNSSVTLSIPVNEADHVKGNTQAQVALVEYGDFQCPACRAYFPLIAQLEEEFGDRVAFVYRHFPLPIHANAKNAAYAAEAAAVQGKFWEMHDILFDKQDDWAKQGSVEDIFVGYAVSLGLNPDQFREDYKSELTKDRVQEDLLAANTDRLNSTPSFFLAGTKLQNPPRSYEAFQQAILAALAKHGQQSEIQQSSDPTGEGDPTEEGS